MVTHDSAGVPSGGRYGCVEWFIREAEKAGFKVGWSRVHCVFGIYTQLRATKAVFQIMLCNWGTMRPLAMTHELLSLLRWTREQDARLPLQTALRHMAEMEANRKKAMADKTQQQTLDIMPDVMRATQLRMGLITPALMVLPRGPVGLYGDRKRRRR